MNILFDPLLPWPAWALLGVLLLFILGYASWTSSQGLDRPRRLSLLSLRLFAFMAIWVILQRPIQLIPKERFQNQKHFAILVDQSGSMQQTDATSSSRWERALSFLDQADVKDQLHELQLLPKFYSFSEEALAQSPENLSKLDPKGETTLFQESFQSVFSDSDVSIKGMLLLSDGHDFSYESISRMSSTFKGRRIPLFAHAIGKKGKVRDASISISNQIPFVHIGQEAKLRAHLRTRGLEYEKVKVELYRENKLYQSRVIEVDQRKEFPIQFIVQEEKPGQYEYRFEIKNLQDELHKSNNVAYMFLNVIQKKSRLLLLEGEPHWDTTFLQRALMSNDKFNIDVLSNYASGQVRRIRNEGQDKLEVPQTKREFAEYDVILIGKSIDQLLSGDALEELKQYIYQDGGTLIFTRPTAVDEMPHVLQQLHPAVLNEEAIAKVSLKEKGEGKNLEALKWQRRLEENPEVPKLTAAQQVSETKRLVSVLAEAIGIDNSKVPALLYRRAGEGQVLAIGVDGLWHWAFHTMIEDEDTPFAQFWDQLHIWLITGGQDLPGEGNRLHLERTSLKLGEQAQLYFSPQTPHAEDHVYPYQVFHDDELVQEGQIELKAMQHQVNFQYTPTKEGLYKVVLLQGSEDIEIRFSVRREQRELLEVEADHDYLDRLCQATGGQLISSFDQVVQQLQASQSSLKSDDQFEEKSIWDHWFVLLSIFTLIGIEWFCRRRWGLW